MAKAFHWADQAADNLIRREDKERYVCASGITPSGTVHIGNFREIITVDLVVKALKKKGKEVRFIYSWDDYDVFRKVPKNMPHQELLQTLLRKPIVDVPDTTEKTESYARFNEVEVEEDLPIVGIVPEFIYQSKKYRNCDYAEGMKQALQNRNKIRTILDKHRKEPLPESYLPISIFCEKCGKDETTATAYDEEYKVTYNCKCGFEDTFDLREKGISKLPWRIDWPMRWDYEKVDFEPGGKDHSSAGGSFDTGKEIIKEIWNMPAPHYIMYDFIHIKGAGGKISSSLGNVITLKECLEIYEPEIIRYLFAGTRPNTEFAISFDGDVIKIYEDYDRNERIYFGETEIKNQDKLDREKRIYELSSIELPTKLPYQPSFRHIATQIQVHVGDEEKLIKEFEEHLGSDFDLLKLKRRIACAKVWLAKYAPEEFKFEIQEEPNNNLSEKEKAVFNQIAKDLKEKEWGEKSLHERFYEVCEANELEIKDFFKAAYQTLINKEKGPRLAAFTLTIKEKAIKLFSESKALNKL
jgi:lysyl-tRNA synthetase, class I